MRYCCLFPLCENIHLAKDVGIISYMMTRLYNIESTIACYKNGNYDYIDKEVKGLNLDFIKKYSKSDFFNGLIYLIKNSKKIDVLNVYHPSNQSLIWAIAYKMLNKNGRVYLKMDKSIDLIDIPRPFFRNDLRSKLKIKILRKYINLITVETINMVKFLNKYNIDAKYIPNGYYEQCNNSGEKLKENIVITVGRIGSEQKRNDLLLEAIKKINKEVYGWRFKFIGPIDKDFEKYIKKYFKDNPYLENVVEFTGPIYDKQKLNNEYQKAKIFCLTSDWEGFPLVIPEAGKNGNYFVCSDIDFANTVIKDRGIGLIFKKGSIDSLSKVLVEACKICDDNKEIHNNIEKVFSEEYYWPKLCEKIYTYLF